MKSKQNFLAENIRAGREYLGLTQHEFAKKCGVSQGLINAIEQGKIRETSKLMAFAMAFGLHAEKLLAYRIDFKTEYNTGTEMVKVYEIPIIDLNQVDDFLAGNLDKSTLTKERLMLPVKNFSEKAFILDVMDDSMTAPNILSSLTPGERIILDIPKEIERNKIYLIGVSEGKKIRKLDLDGNVQLFCPNNKNFSNHAFDESKILAQVILKYTMLS